MGEHIKSFRNPRWEETIFSESEALAEAEKWRELKKPVKQKLEMILNLLPTTEPTEIIDRPIVGEIYGFKKGTSPLTYKKITKIKGGLLSFVVEGIDLITLKEGYIDKRNAKFLNLDKKTKQFIELYMRGKQIETSHSSETVINKFLEDFTKLTEIHMGGKRKSKRSKKSKTKGKRTRSKRS